MRMVLVTGPLGVGKSTLVEGLGRAFGHRRAAVLDGDCLSKTYPGGTSRQRLDLVEDNIVSCSLNFRDWGAEYLFCAWVFTRQRRLDDFVDRLYAQDIPVMVVSLCVSPEARDQRLSERDRPHNFDADTQQWLQKLHDAAHALNADLRIDTSEISQYAVLDQVRQKIEQWDAVMPAHQ